MLVYDDKAAEALRAAADEVRVLGATKYETAHVLLGLLRTVDPVTGTVTADHPQLTEHAVRTALAAPSGQPQEDGDPQAPGRRSTPAPGAEFRRAARQFTAKWRPLVRSRRLQPGLKLGTGELWLTGLEPGTSSARVPASPGREAGRV